MKKSRIKHIIFTLALAALLSMSMVLFASASSVTPSQTEINVEDNAQEVSFDLILQTDAPYAGAEFGIKPSDDSIVFKSIEWSDATRNLQHVQTEKNGVAWFGYFDSKNLEAGEVNVGTVTYTSSGDAGDIKLAFSNIVSLDADNKTASEKSSDGFTVSFKRVDSDAVASTKAALKALPAASKVKLANKTAIERAMKAYNSLTADQKSRIDSALVNNMNSAYAAVTKLQKKQTAYKNKVAAAKKVKAAGFKVKALKGKKAQVTWRANKKVSGFKIQYSTNRKFKKAVKKVTIKRGTIKKTTVKKLAAKKTYYFRIAPYTKVKNGVTGKTVTVQGKWSAVKKIKAKK